MYAIGEMPKEMHAEFQMPGDPYNFAEAEDYLRMLGVVFYRDSLHTFGVLIQPHDGDDTPLTERRAWLAYKSSLVMCDETFAVLDKPGATPKYVARYGSPKWWHQFNIAIHVVEMNEKMVRTA